MKPIARLCLFSKPPENTYKTCHDRANLPWFLFDKRN